jgi:sporulation protein YlmC with PRC-barrel domain
MTRPHSANARHLERLLQIAFKGRRLRAKCAIARSPDMGKSRWHDLSREVFGEAGLILDRALKHEGGIMKIKKIIMLGSVLASWLTTAALGQFSQPIRAGDILGSTIKDPQDQKAGTIKDLAIDLENGRIVEVVVASGGFLGLKEKLVAVIPDNFTVGVDGKTLHVTMDKQRLEGAPAIDISKWQETMEQPRVEQVYQYYSVTPYFLVPEHHSHAADASTFHHMGQLVRVSQLIGMETVNNQDQKLGKVANVIVDLPADRAVEVMIKTGRFLGVPDEVSAVPPQALHFDASLNSLTLDTTRETLESAPHFPDRAWPLIDRDQATAVYQTYHVVPYFLPVGRGSSAQIVPPDLNSQNLASVPLNQGTSQADLEITAKIQKAILDADALSVDARNVKVVTVNGHVTLRGMVDNMEEKRLVGQIASGIVPEADVDNELGVKETAANSAN